MKQHKVAATICFLSLFLLFAISSAQCQWYSNSFPAANYNYNNYYRPRQSSSVGIGYSNYSYPYNPLPINGWYNYGNPTQIDPTGSSNFASLLGISSPSSNRPVGNYTYGYTPPFNSYSLNYIYPYNPPVVTNTSSNGYPYNPLPVNGRVTSGNIKTITQGDDGETLTFQVGDIIEITLPSTYSYSFGPTGTPIAYGNQWVEARDGNGNIPSFHSDVIKPSSLTMPTAGSNSQVLAYEVIGTGEMGLSFECYDNNNSRAIVDTFSVTIRVEP
jgi:hypothetical protein